MQQDPLNIPVAQLHGNGQNGEAVFLGQLPDGIGDLVDIFSDLDAQSHHLVVDQAGDKPFKVGGGLEKITGGDDQITGRGPGGTLRDFHNINVANGPASAGRRAEIGHVGVEFCQIVNDHGKTSQNAA